MTVQLLDTWQAVIGRQWERDAHTDPSYELPLSNSERKLLDAERTERLVHQLEEALYDYGVVISAGDILRKPEARATIPWDRRDAQRRIARVLSKRADIDWG
jgi:hypothetical protein